MGNSEDAPLLTTAGWRPPCARPGLACPSPRTGPRRTRLLRSFRGPSFLSWRRRLLQTEDRGRFGSGRGSAQTLGQGGWRAGREQAGRGPLTLAARSFVHAARE